MVYGEWNVCVCVFICTERERICLRAHAICNLKPGSRSIAAALYRSMCLGSYKITALAGEVDWSRRDGGGGEFYDLVNQSEFVNPGSQRKQERWRLLLLSVGRGEGWGMSVRGGKLTGWETRPLRLTARKLKQKRLRCTWRRWSLFMAASITALISNKLQHFPTNTCQVHYL